MLATCFCLLFIPKSRLKAGWTITQQAVIHINLDNPLGGGGGNPWCGPKNPLFECVSLGGAKKKKNLQMSN